MIYYTMVYTRSSVLQSQQRRAGDQSQYVPQKKRLESLRIEDINCLLQARLALALAPAADDQRNAKSSLFLLIYAIAIRLY